jgi:hypothetical protein
MKTLLGILLFLTCSLAIVTAQTTIGIKGDKFFINGEPTYKGNVWTVVQCQNGSGYLR